MLALLGKTLLFLAGLPLLLDLIEPKKLRRWMKNAKARLKTVQAEQRLVRGARPIEALTRKMARHAAREESLPAEDLRYFTAEQFAAWTRDAHTALAARGHDPRRLRPDFTTPEFERLAREFMLRNDRLPSADVRGLDMIHRDLATRGRRHWKIGVALFMLAPPAAVVLLCLGSERNPVLLGGAFLGAGWLAMLIWAVLRFPTVLLGLLRTEATIRFMLARSTWTLIGKDGNGHPMRWAALVAFIVGSFLDLATSL